MADKRITALNPLPQASLDPAVDVVAIADVSAAETKKLTTSELVAGSIAGVPDGSIPGQKIAPGTITTTELADGSVTTVKLAADAVGPGQLADDAVQQEHIADGAVGTPQLQDGSVTSVKLAAGAVGPGAIADRSIPAIKLGLNTLTSDEIAPNAITASELADNSVDTGALQTDACQTANYQNLSVTNAKLAPGIDGAKLLDGSVTTPKIADGAITGSKLDEVPLSKLPDAAANTVLAGPITGAAASPAYRALVPADLPIATDVALGGVSVPTSGGLVVDPTGSVSIGNTVTPGAHPFVVYDGNGLITSGRDLLSADLPIATVSEPGAVKPDPADLTVAGDGTLSLNPTGVVADTYTKVSVDLDGRVTAGALLATTDLPVIDFDQLTVTGTLPDGVLGPKTVQRANLGDYSISYIQEADPGAASDSPIGELWLQESTGQLRMWNGNSWFPVGFGRLSAENLRFGGTIDASTGLVTAITQASVTAGIVVGDALPNSTDELGGLYYVIDTPGSAINVFDVTGTSFDAGDWVLCVSAAEGWVRIDTIGGGGSGGAQRLDDLLDCTVPSPATGEILVFQASGQWQNVTKIDPGTY